MAVNIDKELFPENTGGAIPTYDVDGNIESVEKLEGELTWRTGVTTQEGFRKALKDLGQDVSYAATPETLRAAFTEINGGGFPEPEDEEKVTFGVINGIVGELANESEPTPVESVTITFNVTGEEAGEVPSVTVGEEVITTLPATLVENKGTELPYVVSCEGYVTQEGTLTFDEDKEVTITLEKEPVPGIEFKSATRMDVSGATAQDNPGIVENGDKYEVIKEDNTILVTDEGLVPYVGGNVDEPKKWVGILVDLGVKAQGTEYHIEDVDYSDAARWGAQNDTTFIMWIYPEKAGTYTFKNVEDEDDTIDVTIEFE